MKTIAIIIISLFGFTAPTSANQPNNSVECCLNLNTTSPAAAEQQMLDQLQHESESIFTENVALHGTSHLQKTVTRKLEEKSMADNIQLETEQFAITLPSAFLPVMAACAQNLNDDEGMMERLQRETESISVTRPLFYIASLLSVRGHIKGAHSSFNLARK